LDGTGYKDLTPMGRQAETMANKIIESGLGDLEELWGLETTLYYPDLYAGATDVVGVYQGQPAILDFKQSNKPNVENGFKTTLNSWEHILWHTTKFMVLKYSLESF
jgi:hypothetical protein